MRLLVWWIGARVIRLGITLVVWGTPREMAETLLDRWGEMLNVHRETESEFRERLHQAWSLPSAGTMSEARRAFESALPVACDHQRAARELLESYQ